MLVFAHDRFSLQAVLAGGDAGALQCQSRRAVVAAPQFYHIMAKHAQVPPMLRSFAFQQAAAGHGIARGQPAGESFTWHPALRIAAIRRFVLKPQTGFAGFPHVQPIAVAALFPIRQVLLVDRLACEPGGDDGPHFRQGIEPFDEIFARLAILQALVEELAHR